MPLPTPNLDSRRFQDIVDQAKRMIPQYCPEWTDHNVSDPGVTLIELFAWMTEMLLYQVNQVPDKLYIKFLDLIGVRLDPPRAARAPITFYLSAPQPSEVTIAAETEVATVRTENSAAIIFTTEVDLVIRPPVLGGAFTRNSRAASGGWASHALDRLGLPGVQIAIFPAEPVPGDAFYIAFERDHSYHVLALLIECELAGGAGIDPTNPPLVWEAWQGGTARWAACEVEYDGTGGFNQSGELILHLPSMEQTDLQGTRAFWLRCRLTERQRGGAGYRVSPEISRLGAEARGGTAVSRHAITVLNEQVGRSDGTPGQRFQLINTPLLARNPARDYLLVEPPNEPAERWQEVADFADSGPHDLHYTLDSLDGTLTLGPALLQPDGSVYRFGVVPTHASELRFSRYQYGGGVTGNVPRGTISVLKTSIPYVARVINRADAVGGRDAQSLDDAKLRAPSLLRTRTRAVTADDFVYLAEQVAGVARAACVSPRAQPGGEGEPEPGQVAVLLLPNVDAPARRIPPEQLTLSAELRAAATSYLSERALVGVRLSVLPAQLFWISVQARLRLPDRSDPVSGAEIVRRAEAALYTYLNPYVGGPRGDGWPFGRDLHVSEIYALLQRVAGVEFVEEVQIMVGEPGRRGPGQQAPARLSIPPQGVVCSDQHRVTIAE
jgi:predicted phage baseplate assembly protein